jgi:hypothetical protein
VAMSYNIITLAVSGDSGDSPQKHVYVHCMSMSVIIFVYMYFVCP